MIPMVVPHGHPDVTDGPAIRDLEGVPLVGGLGDLTHAPDEAGPRLHIAQGLLDPDQWNGDHGRRLLMRHSFASTSTFAATTASDVSLRYARWAGRHTEQLTTS